MKKIALSLTFVILATILLAQVPETIHFQGAIKDENGQPVNDNQFMEFRIYDSEMGGTLLWYEQHLSVTIIEGMFSVELGAIYPFPDNLFDNPTLYITFVFGGSEMTPRQKFTAVPYAIKAASSDEDWTVSGNYVYNSSDSIGIGTETPQANLDIKGDVGIEPSPSEDHQADGITSMVDIDENNFGFGAALYMAPDGHYETASASDENKLPCVALAVEDGTGNKKVLHYGYYRNDSWNWTIGGLIYLDIVEGQITQIQPTGENEIVQVLGFATYTNRIMFNPSYVTSQNYFMNHNPVAEFSASPNPTYQNNVVEFDASASSDPDPWDNIITYEWDFDGDGAFDSNIPNPITQYSYLSPGIFNVKLRVTDQMGLTDETTLEVEILECDIVCDDGIECTIDILDSENCTCTFETIPDYCNDDNTCTDDSCNPLTGCEYENNSNSCDDGDACTENDVCVNGVCQGTPIVCDNPDQCTVGVCDPATGNCIYIPIDDGSPCNDGDPCTFDDVCTAGVCSGTPYDCNDGKPCTIDICNGGSCEHEINPGTCLIDDQCYTNGETNPTNPCEECNSSVDQVSWTYKANGTPCQGDDLCGENFQCQNGSCQAMSQVDCDDSDPNTIDLCDPGSGCYYITNNSPVANFTINPNPGIRNQNITFDASGSYDPDFPEDDIVSFEWDWDGDGTYDETTTNLVITHEFTDAGFFDVKLRVTDSNGLDDEISNTIELDCNPMASSCGTSITLGTVCGDTGSDNLSAQDCGNEWFEVYLEECNNSISIDLTMQITLQIPGGINYDLYVYDSFCSVVDQSTNVSGLELIDIDVQDIFAIDDSREFYIEVRMISGNSFGDWTLDITGNTN